MSKHTLSSATQRGAALVVSLLILLMMTLIGVTAMNVTGLEARMAAGAQDRDLAFQAAESALRDGEDFVNDKGLDDFNGTGGLYKAPTDGSTLWASLDWGPASTQTRAFSGSLTRVPQQPRYIIELLAEVPCTDGTEKVGGGYSEDTKESPCNKYYYRVTTRGVGGAAGAAVMLQSTYINEK